MRYLQDRCALCLKELTNQQQRRQIGKGKDWARYCSKDHQFSAKNIASAFNGEDDSMFTRCDVCSSIFTAKQSTQKLCSNQCRSEQARIHSRSGGKHYATKRAKLPVVPQVEMQCIRCGDAFQRSINKKEKSLYCSLHCQNREAKDRRKYRIRSQYVESVSVKLLRKRDNDICKLCDKPVTDDAVPHPLAPTVDHIIPIAKGGKHERANCQLAHFICNSHKRDQKTGNAHPLRHTG